jgi:hypothetical protein
MKYGKAFAAGIVGAIAMTIIMVMARAMGMPANLEMMLGTMMGNPPSAMAWVIGLIMHLIAGGVFGVIHTLFSGLVVLGMLPAIHPLVPEMMAAPGVFMANLGVEGVVAFVALHLIYGAMVGAMYGPVLHPPLGKVVETETTRIGV